MAKPPPPPNCPHNAGTYKVFIEDGKGNVVGYHERCSTCHLALNTVMT